MKLSIDQQMLTEYLIKQLNFFYPDSLDVRPYILKIIPFVLERMAYCFGQIHKKYYYDNGQALFNHLNSDHYSMFLYWVANSAYKHQYISTAEKAFLLNKALHGIDVFYSVDLPEIFLFVHPVGTVLGKAQYSNFLVVYQNVTVGSDINGVYPKFGESNVLYSKCSVIGNCIIGNNTIIAANSFIKNLVVPENSIVVGRYPETKRKMNTNNNKKDFFVGAD